VRDGLEHWWNVLDRAAQPHFGFGHRSRW